MGQGLFESETTYRQRVTDKIGSDMGLTQGTFESDTSFNARVVRE